MSRGPGRWQRMLLAAVDQAGRYQPVVVTDVALDTLGRSMTESEYRAVTRAARLLQRRGALHLLKQRGSDYTGRLSVRLVAATCDNCSVVGGSEHLPAVACIYCGVNTSRRATYRDDYADCGRRDDGVHPRSGDPA